MKYSRLKKRWLIAFAVRPATFLEIPLSVLHSVIGYGLYLFENSIIRNAIPSDASVDNGSGNPLCGDAHGLKLLKFGLHHPPTSSNPYAMLLSATLYQKHPLSLLHFIISQFTAAFVGDVRQRRKKFSAKKNKPLYGGAFLLPYKERHI